MFYETIAYGHVNVILNFSLYINPYLVGYFYVAYYTPPQYLLLIDLLVCLFDSLCPSQQFFSYVGTGLPGLKLGPVLSRDLYVLLKDTM